MGRSAFSLGSLRFERRHCREILEAGCQILDHPQRRLGSDLQSARSDLIQ